MLSSIPNLGRIKRRRKRWRMAEVAGGGRSTSGVEMTTIEPHILYRRQKTKCDRGVNTPKRSGAAAKLFEGNCAILDSCEGKDAPLFSFLSPPVQPAGRGKEGASSEGREQQQRRARNCRGGSCDARGPMPPTDWERAHGRARAARGRPQGRGRGEAGSD